MKYALFLIVLLSLLACDEHLGDEHAPPAAPQVEQDAAGLVSPALPLTCGPLASSTVAPAVQLCVDDETGCHYFAGVGYGFVPRIGPDGQQMGCHDLVPETLTRGDDTKETIVYLEPVAGGDQ